MNQSGPLSLERAVDYTLQAAAGLSLPTSRMCCIEIFSRPICCWTPKGPSRFSAWDWCLDVTGGGAEAVDGATAENISAGRVDYLAPEQAIDASRADAHSDIYSLGCTLYFLLTGKAPFAGNNRVETLAAHREQPIPALPTVATALQAIFNKMVAKVAEERYASVRDLVTDLRSCQAGLPKPVEEQSAVESPSSSRLPKVDRGAATAQAKTSPPKPRQKSLPVAVLLDTPESNRPAPTVANRPPLLILGAVGSMVLLSAVGLALIMFSQNGEPEGSARKSAVASADAGSTSESSASQNGETGKTTSGGTSSTLGKAGADAAGPAATTDKLTKSTPASGSMTAASGPTSPAGQGATAGSSPAPPTPPAAAAKPAVNPPPPQAASSQPAKPAAPKAPPAPIPTPSQKPPGPTAEELEALTQFEAEEIRWATLLKPSDGRASRGTSSARQNLLPNLPTPSLSWLPGWPPAAMSCSLQAFKQAIMAKINAEKSGLTKKDLLLRGINGDIHDATETGIAARLASGKIEQHPWHELSENSRKKLFSLAIDETNADEAVLAIMDLDRGSVAAAQSHLTRAESLGAPSNIAANGSPARSSVKS